MRAMVIDEWCGTEGIREADVEPPPVAPDGLLVRVRAAGVNPVDTKVRGGYMKEKLPFHFPLVLGWDVAGVVEKAGPAVTAFKPGDEVYGYIRRHHLQYGTYAEYTTATDTYFAHKPEELSFEEAAALPLAGLTAHQALETIGVRGGETLFVGGGSGGGCATETMRPPRRRLANACSRSSPPNRSSAASAPVRVISRTRAGTSPAA